jgi:hypothetical protein
MAPHRLRRGALHLPARRSRQNATFIHYQALTATFLKQAFGSFGQGSWLLASNANEILVTGRITV